MVGDNNKPIRGLYLAVTPNSLLGCFVLTPENTATLGKQQLSDDGWYFVGLRDRTGRSGFSTPNIESHISSTERLFIAIFRAKNSPCFLRLRIFEFSLKVIVAIFAS
jgi:hypothetical protein